MPLLTLGLAMCSIMATLGVAGGEQTDFYQMIVKNPMGEEVSLEKFRGKVSLVVNVASECGYTDEHYTNLVKLHDILSHDGYFTVLAFPCNQFGEQEPGTNEEIQDFAQRNYNAEFPIYDKVEVVGQNAIKAYKYLAVQTGVIPEWNFYKYLVSHEGKPLKVWGPKTSVESIFDDIEAAVKVAKEANERLMKKMDEAKEKPRGDDGNRDDRDESHEAKDEL